MPDPTSREERRKQARPGYDQNARWQYGEPAAPAGPVKIPNKWDKVPGEWAASIGTALSKPNTDTGPSFFKDVADVGRRVAGAMPRPATTPGEENVRVQEHFRPSAGSAIQPNFDRYREMAGLPPAAPVMSNDVQQQPMTQSDVLALKGERNQPQAPVYPAGGGQVPDETQPSSHTPVQGGRSSVSAGVSDRGGQVPTTAADAEFINRQPVTVDPRKRYFDMAGMSLEQRNAMLDAMPEGQRPIQTIRGNTEGWYNPSLSKEFSGLPQALTGVEGRPTLQSENMREQEARDRVSHEGIAGARNATALAMEDKRQTGANARSADGSKGGKSTEWKEFVQKGQDANGNPTEETVVWNPAAGPHTIISPRKTPAKAIASAIIGDFQNEKARDGWLPLFERLDADKVSEIASAMPPEVKEHYRKSLIDKIKESEKDKKAKGK